jgi:hypothetical protein
VIEGPQARGSSTGDGRGPTVFSEKAGFPEAEVSLLGVAGPAVDHMIKHADLEYLGSFCQSASQPDIAFTWGRVPRWIIVCEHKCVCRI